MTIESLDPRRRAAADGVAARPGVVGGAGERRAVEGVDKVRAQDRIEISEQGRALAAAAAQEEQLAEAAKLTPEQLAVLRARVRDGAYGTPEVRAEIANRLLESGDLLTD